MTTLRECWTRITRTMRCMNIGQHTRTRIRNLCVSGEGKGKILDTRHTAQSTIETTFGISHTAKSRIDLSSKNTRQYRRIEGVCVCTECRRSRLAAARLAAESPLLIRLAGRIAGWLSCVARTRETTKFCVICVVQLKSHRNLCGSIGFPRKPPIQIADRAENLCGSIGFLRKPLFQIADLGRKFVYY